MPKRVALWMMIINCLFLLINIFFLLVGTAPTANFIAGMFCLAGLASSYQLYINADE